MAFPSCLRTFSLLLTLAAAAPLSVVAEVFSARNESELLSHIRTANSTPEPDEIRLEPGRVYTLSEVDNDSDGSNGLPSINSFIAISTRGAPATIRRVDAAPGFRIFHVQPSGSLTLVNVNLENGDAFRGGGLFNQGRLLMINSAVSSSSATTGGGIFNSSGDGIRPGVGVLASSGVNLNRAISGAGGMFNDGALLVTDSTISQNANTFSTGGGGIWNRGTATLENSVVRGNRTGAGGGTGGAGIENSNATLSITNSTLSGNCNDSGNGRGGGILNAGTGTVSLNYVTITDNVADVQGGGVYNGRAGSVNVRNSIIAGNFVGLSCQDLRPREGRPNEDCFGTLDSSGFNLIGTTGPGLRCTLVENSTDDQTEVAPLLLDFNVQSGTHNLDFVSPAKDRGGDCIATDQRRFLRPVGPRCDIGASEFGAAPARAAEGPTRRIISSNVTLTANSTRGIVIDRDDIELNCNGHTITGQGSDAGIELKARRGVTVRNCTVANFGNGFDIQDSTKNVFEGNTVTNNRNDGFHIVRSAGNVFVNNTVTANADDGIDLSESSANLFGLNRVSGNRGIGVNVAALSSGNHFIANTSENNNGRGFRIRRGSRYNFLAHNTALANRGRADVEENSNPNYFQANSFGVASGIREREIVPLS